jgi:hypothetical protein
MTDEVGYARVVLIFAYLFYGGAVLMYLFFLATKVMA